MEGEDEESYDPRSFGQAKAWKKFLILVAGAAMDERHPLQRPLHQTGNIQKAYLAL